MYVIVMLKMFIAVSAIPCMSKYSEVNFSPQLYHLYFTIRSADIAASSPVKPHSTGGMYQCVNFAHAMLSSLFSRFRNAIMESP